MSFRYLPDVALVPVKDLPLQDHLVFTPCDVGLASTYLQVLALVESGFKRGVERGSVEKVYRTTFRRLSADMPDQPMHPIPSQAPPMPDLKRAMNQVMFWCAGSQPAQLGPSQPGNRHVQRQGRGRGEGEGECLLEVLGDWSAAPVCLAYFGIQTSEGEEESRIPDGRWEYGDLCGAYSLVESLSFADANLDRRHLRILEVRCRFLRVSYSLGVPFRSGATNEDVRQTISSLAYATRTCAGLEARRVINADADDNAQAGSIDRYTASADDELGNALLAKPREKEGVGIAWVEGEECMGQEVVYRARVKLEGRVGERLRRWLDTTGQGGQDGDHLPVDDADAWRFNGRRLALAREAFQTRVVGGLDEVPVVLSGPLLPRPGMTMDYLPWIQAMVGMWCSGQGSGKHWVERLSREGGSGLGS